MSGAASDRPIDQRWQRRLLPGELAMPGSQRSPRDWLVDAAVFVFAVAFGVITLVQAYPDHGAFLLAVDVVFGSAACLALWWRRSRPVAVGAFVVAAASFATLATAAAVFAVFGVAVRGSRRALALITALALVGIVSIELLYPSVGRLWTQVLVGGLILGVAISLGLFARVRRELVLSLRERAERLESEQRLHLERARDAERRRIAREMHDVLAHRLSLLSVHAGALEFRRNATPDEVSEAAGVIRASAHVALQELRDVIGVLQADADESVPQPPQPTLAEIPTLVAESRAAGMNVRLHDGASANEEIPAAVGRTAYRVVQEGLTNARKHAPGAVAEVTLAAQADALVVEVVSRPAIGAVGSRQLAETGSGTGLVGLAERVTLSGGDLRSGRNDAGDFVLRATLPWSR